MKKLLFLCLTGLGISLGATPPYNSTLQVDNQTGAIIAPVTAAQFAAANGFGTNGGGTNGNNLATFNTHNFFGLGDSLTTTNPSSFISYPSILKTNFNYTIITNDAIGGTSSSACLLRFVSDTNYFSTFTGLKTAIGICVGKNDMNGMALNESNFIANEVLQNYTNIINLARFAGLQSVIITQPFTVGAVYTSYQNIEPCRQIVNSNLLGMTNYPGVMGVISFDAIAPPTVWTNADGTLNTNTTLDGLHPTASIDTNLAESVNAILTNSLFSSNTMFFPSGNTHFVPIVTGSGSTIYDGFSVGSELHLSDASGTTILGSDYGGNTALPIWGLGAYFISPRDLNNGSGIWGFHFINNAQTSQIILDPADNSLMINTGSNYDYTGLNLGVPIDLYPGSLSHLPTTVTPNHYMVEVETNIQPAGLHFIGSGGDFSMTTNTFNATNINSVSNLVGDSTGLKAVVSSSWSGNTTLPIYGLGEYFISPRDLQNGTGIWGFHFFNHAINNQIIIDPNDGYLGVNAGSNYDQVPGINLGGILDLFPGALTHFPNQVTGSNIYIENVDNVGIAGLHIIQAGGDFSFQSNAIIATNVFLSSNLTAANGVFSVGVTAPNLQGSNSVSFGAAKVYLGLTVTNNNNGVVPLVVEGGGPYVTPLDLQEWTTNGVPFAAVDGYGLFRSTNGSTNHVAFGVRNNPTNGMYFINSNIIAFCNGGTNVFMLSNGVPLALISGVMTPITNGPGGGSGSGAYIPNTNGPGTNTIIYGNSANPAPPLAVVSGSGASSSAINLGLTNGSGVLVAYFLNNGTAFLAGPLQVAGVTGNIVSGNLPRGTGGASTLIDSGLIASTILSNGSSATLVNLTNRFLTFKTNNPFATGSLASGAGLVWTNLAVTGFGRITKGCVNFTGTYSATLGTGYGIIVTFNDGTKETNFQGTAISASTSTYTNTLYIPENDSNSYVMVTNYGLTAVSISGSVIK